MRLLRQVLVSLVVIVAAAAAYIFFVPGSSEFLARFGIPVPAGPDAADPAARTANGNPPAIRRPGGAPGRAVREMVVVTAPVGLAHINDKLTAIGEGEAAHSVTVMSPAAGTLTELLVRPGDQVSAGAVIGRLDDDAERIALERARLALEDAQAALARTQELASANAATAVQLNTAQLAADNARLELQNAELALRRRAIVSPIAGTVGLFEVSTGNAVTAQSTVTTIQDTSHILVSFWVPERYASAVAPGMPVSAAAVALPGETIAGSVVAVDNRVDPTSRTLKVQAQIDNAGGRLRPGMSFSVGMAFAGETFPTVDPLAIQWSSDGSYVWTYADGKVDRLFVEIIQRNSDGVLVKGDLDEGDQVVTQGVQQLTAGAQVRLLDDAPAAGEARTENPS